MPPPPALNLDSLVALGAERLARLVLDESEASAAFAKRVKAALVATQGPAAVAAMIDKRLAGLERARAFVDIERSRAFEDDLATTVDVIAEELGALDPSAAIDRLLRFLATARTVFDRIDDSSGRVQGVYHRAADATAPLVARLSSDDAVALPERLMRRLADDPWGYATAVAIAAAALLPPAARDRLDDLLAAATEDDRDGERTARIGGLRRIRQAIADRRGDVDGWIALETAGSGTPDSFQIAARLHAADRHAQALDWLRRPMPQRLAIMRWSDRADGSQFRDHGDRARAELEALILEAMDAGERAQAVRWEFFARTLDIEMLRQHLAKLPDFAEFDVLDRAFAFAAQHADIHRALALFLGWPRLDLAARHVLAHRARWDGRHYGALAPAAEALAAEHPDAATILFRALLDDILKRAQARAYAHGAAYLAALDALAPRLNPAVAALSDHAAYRAALATAHARKASFWAHVRKFPDQEPD